MQKMVGSRDGRRQTQSQRSAGIRDALWDNQVGRIFCLERFDCGFNRVCIKIVKGCGEAVTETGGVVAFDPKELVDELVFVDEPAFGALDDGDFVGFKATTAAEDEFTTVDLVCFEAVCHLILQIPD